MSLKDKIIQKALVGKARTDDARSAQAESLASSVRPDRALDKVGVPLTENGRSPIRFNPAAPHDYAYYSLNPPSSPQDAIELLRRARLIEPALMHGVDLVCEGFTGETNGNDYQLDTNGPVLTDHLTASPYTSVPSDCVLVVKNGLNAGVYTISSSTGTVIEIDGIFPAGDTGAAKGQWAVIAPQPYRLLPYPLTDGSKYSLTYLFVRPDDWPLYKDTGEATNTGLSSVAKGSYDATHTGYVDQRVTVDADTGGGVISAGDYVEYQDAIYYVKASAVNGTDDQLTLTPFWNYQVHDLPASGGLRHLHTVGDLVSNGSVTDENGNTIPLYDEGLEYIRIKNLVDGTMTDHTRSCLSFLSENTPDQLGYAPALIPADATGDFDLSKAITSFGDVRINDFAGGDQEVVIDYREGLVHLSHVIGNKGEDLNPTGYEDADGFPVLYMMACELTAPSAPKAASRMASPPDNEQLLRSTFEYVDGKRQSTAGSQNSVGWSIVLEEDINHTPPNDVQNDYDNVKGSGQHKGLHLGSDGNGTLGYFGQERVGDYNWTFYKKWGISFKKDGLYFTPDYDKSGSFDDSSSAQLAVTAPVYLESQVGGFPITLSTGSNRFRGVLEDREFDFMIADGTYTQSEIVTEIESGLEATVGLTGSGTVSQNFSVYAQGSQVRIETRYDIRLFEDAGLQFPVDQDSVQGDIELRTLHSGADQLGFRFNKDTSTIEADAQDLTLGGVSLGADHKGTTSSYVLEGLDILSSDAGAGTITLGAGKVSFESTSGVPSLVDIPETTHAISPDPDPDPEYMVLLLREDGTWIRTALWKLYNSNESSVALAVYHYDGATFSLLKDARDLYKDSQWASTLTVGGSRSRFETFEGALANAQLAGSLPLRHSTTITLEGAVEIDMTVAAAYALPDDLTIEGNGFPIRIENHSHGPEQAAFILGNNNTFEDIVFTGINNTTTYATFFGPNDAESVSGCVFRQCEWVPNVYRGAAFSPVNGGTNSGTLSDFILEQCKFYAYFEVMNAVNWKMDHCTVSSEGITFTGVSSDVSVTNLYGQGNAGVDFDPTTAANFYVRNIEGVLGAKGTGSTVHVSGTIDRGITVLSGCTVKGSGHVDSFTGGGTVNFTGYVAGAVTASVAGSDWQINGVVGSISVTSESTVKFEGRCVGGVTQDYGTIELSGSVGGGFTFESPPTGTAIITKLNNLTYNGPAFTVDNVYRQFYAYNCHFNSNMTFHRTPDVRFDQCSVVGNLTVDISSDMVLYDSVIDGDVTANFTSGPSATTLTFYGGGWTGTSEDNTSGFFTYVPLNTTP